jgi:hypothetical protein
MTKHFDNFDIEAIYPLLDSYLLATKINSTLDKKALQQDINNDTLQNTDR